MLVNSRISETFSLFSRVLQIEDNASMDIGIGTPIPVKSLVPMIMRMLADGVKAHPDQAEGILNWMTDGILYMKGDLDVLPTFDFGFNISIDTEATEEQRRKQILDKNRNQK